MAQTPPLNTPRRLPEGELPLAVQNKVGAFLLQPSRKVNFRCRTCDSVRAHPYYEDPGYPGIELLRCADVNLNCGVPVRVDGLRESPNEFVPGSLVLVKKEGIPWPAIVEFSIDDIADYFLQRDWRSPPHAYYITFIGERGPRTGGWYQKMCLKGLHPVDLNVPTHDQTLQNARRLCANYLTPPYCSLRRRFRDLAYACSRVQLPIVPDVPQPERFEEV